MNIDKEHFEGGSRILNLPGITLSIREMLRALNVVGGEEATALIEEKFDIATKKIVEGWPTRLDTSKAESLGFARDTSFEQMLKEYIEDYAG